jgi:hypothetical protein
MKDVNKLQDDFHLRCGQILRMFLRIEELMNFYIMQYFVRPQNQKSFFFRDVVLAEMSFRSKLILYNKICKEIGADEDTVKKVNEDVKFVQEKRNTVAHGEALFHDTEEGFKLYTKKQTREMHKENELLLTDELVKEVDEKTVDALGGMNKIYAKAGAFRNV